MEILKNLSRSELDALRSAFENHSERSLNERQFKRVLLRASRGKTLTHPITKSFLGQLFANVDTTGSGRVTWDAFTMFLIDHALNIVGDYGFNTKAKTKPQVTTTQTPPSPSKGDEEACTSSSTDGGEDSRTEYVADTVFDDMVAFRPYHVLSSSPHSYGTQVVGVYGIPALKKVVKVTSDIRRQGGVTVHHMDEKMSLYGRVAPFSETAVAWEYIPLTGGVSHSHSLACCYNGGRVQLSSLEKQHSVDEVLTEVKAFNTTETQTAVRWCPKYARLILGSRGGIVSVWDVDARTVHTQERLHTHHITAMRARGGTLYTASVDRFQSVKVVDLERSVVRHAFSDHLIGGALSMELDDEFLFSTGFEGKVVQRVLQTPSSHPTLLYDSAQPHIGRISALYRPQNSPLLVTGDTKGMLKMWDLRMCSCVQTLLLSHTNSTSDQGTRDRATKLGSVRQSNSYQSFLPSSLTKTGGPSDSADACAVNAIHSLSGHGRLLVSSTRAMVTLTEEDTTSPHLADEDHACRFLLLPTPETIITVHDRGVKLWCTLTGHILYSSGKDVVQDDISACSLVEPLRRQFLLGSMAGEVKIFSVALGMCTGDMHPALRDAGYTAAEVVSLHTIAKFREYSVPYAVVVLPREVCLLPVDGNCTAQSVVRVRAVNTVLDGKHTIKQAQMHSGHLFVSTSNSMIHLVDLTYATTEVTTIALPHGELETLTLGVLQLADELIPCSQEQRNGRLSMSTVASTSTCTLSNAFTPHPLKSSTSGGPSARNSAPNVFCTLFFAGDSDGHLYVGLALRGSRGADGHPGNMIQGRKLFSLLGDWIADTPSKSWRWWNDTAFRHREGKEGTLVDIDPYRSSYRQRKSNAFSLSASRPYSDYSGHQSVVSMLDAPPHATTAHQNTIITHVHFFQKYHVLATAGMKGDVRMWDLFGIAKHVRTTYAAPGHPSSSFSASVDNSERSKRSFRAASKMRMPCRGGGYCAPVLISSWFAHDKGLSSMSGLEYSSLHLPVLVTCGTDNAILLWSADGIKLGSLATGRQMDDASGGRRFGLEAYLLHRDPSSLDGHWNDFLEYIKQRRGCQAPEVEDDALHETVTCQSAGNDLSEHHAAFTGSMRLPSTAPPLPFNSDLIHAAPIRICATDSPSIADTGNFLFFVTEEAATHPSSQRDLGECAREDAACMHSSQMHTNIALSALNGTEVYRNTKNMGSVGDRLLDKDSREANKDDDGCVGGESLTHNWKTSSQHILKPMYKHITLMRSVGPWSLARLGGVARPPSLTHPHISPKVEMSRRDTGMVASILPDLRPHRVGTLQAHPCGRREGTDVTYPKRNRCRLVGARSEVNLTPPTVCRGGRTKGRHTRILDDDSLSRVSPPAAGAKTRSTHHHSLSQGGGGTTVIGGCDPRPVGAGRGNRVSHFGR